MWPAFPASDYYGPSTPPRRHHPTASLPTTARRQQGGRHRDGSHVHHASIDGVGAQLFPLQHRHEYAADLPRGLTTDCTKPASESPPANGADGAALRPTSTRLEPASLLRGFNHWFTSVTPFRLAERALDRLVVPARLAFVRAAPALTRASGIRPPSASTRLLRQPGDRVLSSPLDSWRLVAHNAVVTRMSLSFASRLTLNIQQLALASGSASPRPAQLANDR